MVKGDDALRRKRSKVNRKRRHNSESSVSARVAAIIVAKRRRKAGKRRICEGMCFSLPTADDPFNERQEKKLVGKSKRSKKQRLNQRQKDSVFVPRGTDRKRRENALMKEPAEKMECNGEGGGFENDSISMLLMLCLKAIENAWVEDDILNKDVAGDMLSNSWGVEFFRVFSAGLSVVSTGDMECATRNQVAWVASTAADIVARKEKHSIMVHSPFLLFIVPTQDRATEVRSVCKPLKAFGFHTVSLHPGTSVDYQVHGLKNCDPEFLISTPERLLELVSLKAIDISGTFLLVVDGLRKFIDLGLLDYLKSIRENISMNPQIITFSKCHGEMSVTMLLNLMRGSVYRLSADESVASTSSFVSQYIHLYTSEEEKQSEVLQILTHSLGNPTVQRPKVLLICGNASKINPLSSFLNHKGYAICDGTRTSRLQKPKGDKFGIVLVKDFGSLRIFSLDKFEIVIFVDFPSSINDYIAVLTKIARHTLVGQLHSFFSTVDAPLAHSLVEVLEQCGQAVPGFLKHSTF